LKRHFLQILLTSALLTASFPPLRSGFLVCVALVPFLYLLEDRHSLKNVFGSGYLTGLLFSAGTLYWIAWPTIPGFAGAMLYLPLFFAFFGLTLGALRRRLGIFSYVFAPFVWTGLEYASCQGSLAFPWNSLSTALTRIPALIQYASLTGAQGVSFWIVGVNVLVFFLIRGASGRRRLRLSILAAVAVFTIPLIYGLAVLRHPAPKGETLRISLLQGNIDPYKKWTPTFIDSNFVIYDGMTRTAARDTSDLVVWPESATPCYLRHKFVYLNWIKYLSDTLKVPILTGSPDYEWTESQKAKMYNAAFLIRPGSWELDAYYKMRLVPFSERVPFSGVLPFLEEWAMKVTPELGDYSPGDTLRLFRFTAPSSGRRHAFATLICFESVFPDLARKFSRLGAEFLVIITNDGWFGNTSGPRQHADIAVLRAVETGRWIARCANTGISEFIDPHGRILSRTPFNRKAILTGDIVPITGQTVYTRIPWLFSGFVLLTDAILLLCILLPAALLRRQPVKKGAKGPGPVPVALLLIPILFAPARAEEIQKVTLSTVKSRSIAMAGAFSSVRDDLAALDFNPATFGLEDRTDESHGHVFLNPFGPLLLAKNAGELKYWPSALGYVFQGIGVSLRRIQFGLVFGNETLAEKKRLSREDWFGGSGFQRNSHSSIGFSLALAPRVSLGAAGELTVRDGHWARAKFGYRYGLQIHPRGNLSVGMFYIDFPKSYERERLTLERLDDATLNVGITYRPFPWIQLAGDMRNVSDEGKDVVREPHFGFEVVPWRHLSVQGGYYRIWDARKDVFSMGIGLLDQHAWVRSGRPYASPRLVFRSAIVLENDLNGSVGWFFLTGSVRL
jgi:apolipoprotein N-acyltransferase